jgi:hypothetical protein
MSPAFYDAATEQIKATSDKIGRAMSGGTDDVLPTVVPDQYPEAPMRSKGAGPTQGRSAATGHSLSKVNPGYSDLPTAYGMPPSVPRPAPEPYAVERSSTAPAAGTAYFKPGLQNRRSCR